MHIDSTQIFNDKCPRRFSSPSICLLSTRTEDGGTYRGHQGIEEGVVLVCSGAASGTRWLGTQDAAEALCFLPARPRMAGDLDEHVGLRDVDGVVSHLGQEDGVHLPGRSTVRGLSLHNKGRCCSGRVSNDTSAKAGTTSMGSCLRSGWVAC